MIRIIFAACALVSASLGASLAVKAQALPEHEMLTMDDGVWRATISLHREGGKVEQYVGRETNSMIGDLWSIGKLEVEIGGAPYEGFATLGYDAQKGQYVGTWIDNYATQITDMHGSYDPATKTLVLYYYTVGPNGVRQDRKNVMVYETPDRRDFDSYLKKGDDWVPAMEILYERLP